MSTEIFTLREVADYLKVTERTIYRLLSERQMPAFKVGGTWRFRRAELDMWITERSVAEAEPAQAAVPKSRSSLTRR